MNVENYTNFKMITMDDFERLSTYEKGVLYIVDNSRFFKVTKDNGIKEIFHKVKITYVDEGNNLIEEKYYMENEKINLLFREIILENDDENFSCKVYSDWICEGEIVNNVAPEMDKTYISDVLIVSLNRTTEIVINSNNDQYVEIPITIRSNKKIYVNNIYYNNCCFYPSVIYNSGEMYENIINFYIENLAYLSTARSFPLNLDLYLDENYLKKICTVLINVVVNGSENSTGD